MKIPKEGDRIAVSKSPPESSASAPDFAIVCDEILDLRFQDMPIFTDWHVDKPTEASDGKFPDRANFVIQTTISERLEQLFVKLAYSEGGGGAEFSRVRRHLGEEVENLRHINKLEPDSGNPDTDNEKKKVGHVAKIVAQATLYVKRGDGSYEPIPALIERYVPGEDLEKWMSEWLASENRVLLNELGEKNILMIWSILALASSNIVRRIHNRGVIHGWIQPRHIILSKSWNEIRSENINQLRIDSSLVQSLLSGVHLVGFGTSAIVFDPDKGADAKRLMKDEVFAAPELRNTGTVDGIFSYPVDLFSLGAILLYAAVGLRYKRDSEAVSDVPKLIQAKIEEKIRTAGGGSVVKVKENVANTLKESGWPTEALARVIDKAMRTEQEDRYLCAEEMIQFILNLVGASDKDELLSHVLPRESSDSIQATLTSVLSASGSKTPKVDDHANFLSKFFSSRVSEIGAWQGLSAFSESPHFEVYGSRDLLLDWLCSFMSHLREGDEYCTRTILPYWTDENLGSTGRFLVKNKDLVMQGVKVKRIFMVAHDFAELPINEQLALVGQREMLNELSKTSRRDHFDVRVRRVENLSKLMQVERRHQLVAFVKRDVTPRNAKKDAERVYSYFGFSFMSRGGRYRDFDESYLRAIITKLRFRHLNMKDNDDRSAVEQFNANWEGDSDPLDEYLNYGVSLETLLSKTP